MYNINKSTLFWKIILNKIFNIKQNTKKNHKKIWIILDYINNINKSYKLEL